MPVATPSAVGFIGVDVTRVDTVQKFPLGQTITTANGGRYRYIRAGAAIAQYDALKADAAEGAFDWQPTAAADEGILGIAQVAIGDNEFGWVLIEGKGFVKVAATVVAGASLVTIATAGTLDDTAAAAGNALATGVGVGVTCIADDSPSAGIAAVFVSS